MSQKWVISLARLRAAKVFEKESIFTRAEVEREQNKLLKNKIVVAAGFNTYCMNKIKYKSKRALVSPARVERRHANRSLRRPTDSTGVRFHCLFVNKVDTCLQLILHLGAKEKANAERSVNKCSTKETKGNKLKEKRQNWNDATQ